MSEDAINTVAAVASAVIALLTLIDQHRGRRGSEPNRTKVASLPASELDYHRPNSGYDWPPTPAPPNTAGPAVRHPGRSGKASFALILGLWGFIIVRANLPGEFAADAGDYLLGLGMSLAALIFAAKAFIDIHAQPGMRGQWLAALGVAGGAVGLLDRKSVV